MYMVLTLDIWLDNLVPSVLTTTLSLGLKTGLLMGNRLAFCGIQNSTIYSKISIVKHRNTEAQDIHNRKPYAKTIRIYVYSIQRRDDKT